MDSSGGIVKTKARVQHSYTPEQDDELRLEVGEIIDILKQDEEGWWEGNLNGRVGMFPSNFVELIPDTPAQENNEKGDESKDQVQFREIKGKKVQGVGLGNIFGGGPIKLRPTSGLQTSVKKEHAIDAPESKEEKTAVNHEIANKRDSDEIIVKREKTDRAIVRFSYAAENDDELSLEEGDILNILDTTIEDSGWWRGELRGKVGVFPDNFVEMLPQEETKPIPKKPPPPKTHKVETVEKTPSIRPSTPPTSDKKVEPDTKQIMGLQTILDRKSELRPSQLNHVQSDRSVLKKKEPELPSPGDKSHIPSKKPALPPPVGRKPNQSLRHTDHPKPDTKTAPLHEVKDVRAAPEVKDVRAAPEVKDVRAAPEVKDVRVEAKVVKMEESVELRSNEAGVNLDAVESSEKLSHLTAHRAKFPNRRPPSTVLTLNSSNEEEKAKDTSPGIIEKVGSVSAMSVSMDELKDEPVKEGSKKLTPAPVTTSWSSTAGLASSSMKRPPNVTGKQESIDSLGASMSNISQSVIDDLQKKIHDANTVTKSMFNELKSDNEQLRREITNIKNSHQKRLVELMNEIDEEKKGRLMMQVEIERIKKLVLSNSTDA